MADDSIRQEMKRRVMFLAAGIVVLDAAVIAIYYAFHIPDRSAKTQQTFVAVWVVLTLLVVATLMKPIRALRRGGRAAGGGRRNGG